MPLSFLGSLTTDGYYGRPAAYDSKKTTSLPLPNALVSRETVDGPMTLIELRLLHALLYLSWEAMLLPDQPAEMAGAELRKVIGYEGAEGNSSIRAGFDRLASRTLRIKSPWDINAIIETPVFRSWSYCRKSARFWWIVSAAIEEWCQENIAFAPIDLNVIAALQTPAAIRLYEICCAMAPRTYSSKIIDIPEFRNLFDIGIKYPKFSEFTGRVVTPAVNQVNTVSPFDVTTKWLSRARDGRYDGVQVSVTTKSKHQVPRRVSSKPMQLREFPDLAPCTCCRRVAKQL
jgi:hypothetical protein